METSSHVGPLQTNPLKNSEIFLRIPETPIFDVLTIIVSYAYQISMFKAFFDI